jgi:hypothetical protein
MSTTRQHGDLFRPSINKNEDRDLRGLFHWEEHDAKADMREAASYGGPTAQVRLANNQRVRERIKQSKSQRENKRENAGLAGMPLAAHARQIRVPNPTTDGVGLKLTNIMRSIGPRRRWRSGKLCSEKQ